MENKHDKIALQFHLETEKDLFKNNKKILKTEIIDRPHITNATDWKILDLGCGSGIHVKYFIDKHPEINCIKGIDASEKMIEIANKYNSSEKIEYLVGDMNKLPFNNNFFDFIFSRNTIHYSLNLDQTFAELSRVIKDGGKLFFQVSHPIYNVFLKKNKNYMTKDNVGFKIQGGTTVVTHPTFTFEEYINSIIKNKFTIIEMHEYLGRTPKIDGYVVPAVLSFLLSKSV